MSQHMPMRAPEFTPLSESAGTGLIDVLLAMSVIIAAALTAFHLTVSTVATGAANERLSAARRVIRKAMTDLERRTFDEVFLAFNDNPMDDPEGPSSAPGAETFYEAVRSAENDELIIRRVDGASQTSNRAGLFRVVVEFPTASDGSLCETRTDFLKGFPSDLNRNGHSADPHLGVADVDLLPMRLRVVWEGSAGPESLELARVFSRR